VVPKKKLSFILGNPPFVGHQYRNNEQQEDMKIVYKDSVKFGKLDYVCCWYQKAIKLMINTHIHAAFVSTNSIVQGESVAIMWRPFFETGAEIVFAYRSFPWSNEAKGKATVHCVIIGFTFDGNQIKNIFDGNIVKSVMHINGYLLDGPNLFIQSRGKPLRKDLPEMSKGSQPTDGGHLIFSQTERDELVTNYPQTGKWIKKYIGSEEFINNKIRYCLWLKGVAPAEYRHIRPIIQRLEMVSECRQKSPTASVQRDAATPMLFTQIRQPETRFLVVPEISSEQRKYIPIGYLEPSVIANNRLYILPNATLYLFGVLTSNVHMAWTRVVCGRLEMRYCYTPAVYNNFPWPDVTDEQKTVIENLAQNVLSVRALFLNNSLADLYDPLTMPPELLKAHQALDKAVMKLYKFRKDTPEAEIVAELMGRYEKLVRGDK
jgi:hypothetical protein